jgi:hypothetical protein
MKINDHNAGVTTLLPPCSHGAAAFSPKRRTYHVIPAQKYMRRIALSVNKPMTTLQGKRQKMQAIGPWVSFGVGTELGHDMMI